MLLASMFCMSNVHDAGTHQRLRRLLVPIDFTKGAEVALRRALLLPLAQDATIHIIHVLSPNLPAQARDRDTAETKRRLDDLISRVREEVKGRKVNVNSDILCCEPFVEIIRCSRSVSAELVVIGRHGQRPVRDMFIGTTAQRVVNMWLTRLSEAWQNG